MKHILLTMSTLLWTIAPLMAQNGTEVYLLEYRLKGHTLSVSNPLNVSDHKGYDNQPFFHPSKPLLYYTSMMPDAQTDIWVYSVRTGGRLQLTNTPDSEYSPTVLPHTEALSCIVQRKANGDQDLVRYSLAEPRQTQLILESKRSGKIGYQAWLNATQWVAFVLGSPQTLHYYDSSTQQDTVIAAQIGRSLHRIPKQQAFSFVQQIGDKWLIRSYEPASKHLKNLAESAPDSEHYNAWLPQGGHLLESRGTQLWHYDLDRAVWQQVHLPETLTGKKLSRIAVSKRHLALVVDEP